MNPALSPLVKETLREARELVRNHWTQTDYARNADGKGRDWCDSDAVCWCSLGAICFAASKVFEYPSREYFDLKNDVRNVVSEHLKSQGEQKCLTVFNDTSDHETVVKMWDSIPV